jgi:transposase
MVPGQGMNLRLQSFLAWLGNRAQMPYETQQELLQEWSGVQWSVGTLVAVNQRVAKAVESSGQEAWQRLPHEAVVYVDETPWPVKGVKEWLWHLGTEQVSLFYGADTRSWVELEQCLGATFRGCLVSDDFSVYNGYAAARQQKCLAHLRRHFKRVEQQGHGQQPELAKAFKVLIDKAFDHYQTYQTHREGQGFSAWANEFRHRVQTAIDHWKSKAGYEAGKLL